MAEEEKKEGAPVKLKKTSKRYSNYEISGSTLKRKNKSCPKCGPGIFLADHPNRVYCGACGYVEMKEAGEAPKNAETKVSEPKGKEKPAEKK